eukprot:SAG31_NODE_3936_length_3736_cov_6.504302_3_plen_112_part_00
MAVQIATCRARWWEELPDRGAVSLSTMHDLQWKTGDLSDGDNEPWTAKDAGAWRPWRGDEMKDGRSLSASELKALGNKVRYAVQFHFGSQSACPAYSYCWNLTLCCCRHLQ